MPMNTTTLLVRAEVGDAFDGLIRLAVDMQRFGYALNRATTENAGGGTRVEMELSCDRDVDCENISARLARHPCVRRVEAFTVGGGHSLARAGQGSRVHLHAAEPA